MQAKKIDKIKWTKLPWTNQKKIKNLTRNFYDDIVRPIQECRTEYDHDFYSRWYVARDDVGLYVHQSLMKVDRPDDIHEPITILSKVYYLDHNCYKCHEPALFIQSRDLVDFELTCGWHTIFGIHYKQQLYEVTNQKAKSWLSN